MNKALPIITESEADLLLQLRRESDAKKRLRLQAISLLATKQACSRLALSQLLAVHRNTIAAWLTLYADGGLTRLLERKQPPGKKSSLSDEALGELQARLATPVGFATYKEIQHFLQAKHHLSLSYAAVHALVRYKLKAKAKRPRPSHPKKKRKP